MKFLLFLFILFSCVSASALPCSETPVWEKEIAPEMEEIKNFDKKGEKDFQEALNTFQKVSKKDNKQLAAYSISLINKPEYVQLQRERKNYGLKIISLVESDDCEAIKENNKKLLSAISRQWLLVLAEVKADTQMYMAKNMENSPDINATTDAGKKVILHANGTWSEARKK